ncbi:hypothetical protein [Longimycelium tulufanense]|uniref:hypothetical protein n=1 Tax=Longimycelium tulufanense TaxID=907463 RepID=UPI001E3B2A22|nr:hypothetical protein [Longimycelium tulufanense]
MSTALPPELPAPAELLAARAAELLGWRGAVLPPMSLLGRRVVPVVELLTDRHAERLSWDCGPVTDRTAVSTWVWPELADRVPSPAVRLVGVIAPARHWRTALACAGPFAKLCPAAVVLPATVTGSEDYQNNCLLRTRLYGVAVLTAACDGAVELELPGSATDEASGAAELASSAAVRWMHEVLYERLLAETPAPAGC